MTWILPASNRLAISEPLSVYVERYHDANEGLPGDVWFLHAYVKQAEYDGRVDRLRDHGLPLVVAEVLGKVGHLKLLDDGKYHVVGCSSPEYHCYAPFEELACTPSEDCNYELAQLWWGLSTALRLARDLGVDLNRTYGVDVVWWDELLHGSLAWYAHDSETGFRLDRNCSFDCPHRHFSHLLQLFDLEVVSHSFGSGAPSSTTPGSATTTLDALVEQSIDRWHSITCNESNIFNEECRGFSQCAMATMSALAGRAEAAAGNLSRLVDSVVLPNGMYGEMVFMNNPGEFSPVAESAYCGVGSLNEMLLRTHPETSVLSVFGGVPTAWSDVAFHQLRARGALLVSAVRNEGRCSFVRVLSELGGVVLLKAPSGWDTVTTVPSSVAVAPARGLSNVLNFTLEKGQHVLLYSGDVPPSFVIEPVPTNASEEHWFGYSRPMPPMH